MCACAGRGEECHFAYLNLWSSPAKKVGRKEKRFEKGSKKRKKGSKKEKRFEKPEERRAGEREEDSAIYATRVGDYS